MPYSEERHLTYRHTHRQYITIVSGTGQNPGLDQSCALTINDKKCNNANKLTTNNKKNFKILNIINHL